MISRYTPQDFAALWSDEHRFASWLRVELAACEAMEEAGLVPSRTAQTIRALNLSPDPARIAEIERTTRHDVIAFLTHIEELGGPPARWLHRGMTSSDVLDTAFALLLTEACDLLLVRMDGLLSVLEKRAREHAHTPMIGRSHGMHAEPVTFGLVLAGHYAEMKRNRERLSLVRPEVAVGKISGAVGTYAHLSPEIEARALSSLGLSPETVSTQIVARDRHAALMSCLALVASSIERLATNIRHWARTELGEAEEFFAKGQKGSSAMPHKRNPILSENLCGLARIVRANAQPAFEDVVLWHERDISHSSVERMLVPDSTTLVGFMLDRLTQLVDQLVVYPQHMQQHLDQSAGLVFSESVLLALIDRGLGRQEAYRIVQTAALCALQGKGDFRQILEQDSQVTSHLSSQELARCFDLQYVLRHVDAILERTLGK